MPTKSGIPTRQERKQQEQLVVQEKQDLKLGIKQFKRRAGSIVRPILKDYVHSYCAIPWPTWIIPVFVEAQIRAPWYVLIIRVPFGPSIYVYFDNAMKYENFTSSNTIPFAEELLLKMQS